MKPISRCSPAVPNVEEAAAATLGAGSHTHLNLVRIHSHLRSQKHRSYKHSVTHLHKGPLLPSWVRDFQATFLDFKALIEDNVQIKRPRAPPLPMQIPAQLSLPHREDSELSTSYGVIH